ncbi:MAG: GNAT family N-acetyltransferase [Prevotellaceae bacterium]|jgi:lipid II:glycine glycyltransferase (peptidoglycan interpeptide bridge formation enzyme)|nr:GNAT family N-acetyltransferase [Prevotellaceae bacterium]
MPVFLQAWWRDAVSGKRWEAFLYEENGKILASFVFETVKKMGVKFIINPQLTQISGLWIDYPKNIAAQKKLALEKKIMNYFIDKLEQEKFAYFEHNFHCSFTNWLPFYWKKFSQSTRYTYQIEDISKPEICFGNFDRSKQKQIKKAERNGLIVDFQLDAKNFYRLAKNNLQRQGKKISFSENLFLSIFETCKERETCCIIAIKDKNEIIHSAAFFVADSESAYYLISTITPEFRGSGASSLMVWEAVKYFSDKVKTFDFEGSMSENIENSFRNFDARQTPYFNIWKSKSKIISYLLGK